MKKYLTIGAILGAIAFVSVSFLAQAEPETSAVTTAVEQAAQAPAADTMVAPAPADDPAKAECEAQVPAKNADGADLTEEEKVAAVAKCMADKALGNVAPAPEAMPVEAAPATVEE